MTREQDDEALAGRAVTSGPGRLVELPGRDTVRRSLERPVDRGDRVLTTDMTRIVADTTRKTVRGSSEQPRQWMAVSLIVILATTVVLAATRAPPAAYAVPFVAMILAANTATGR